ncbi:MAG TPA: ornithine carbamoyltransferase, partial [Proteobacteria bacterium]|nr:ornithine carbamoyltransferase [Pseudomonadota bacterium]
FGHETLKEFADYSSVPVINGLSDSYHPCQVLSDLLTISERGIDLDSLSVAYVGDGNNVCHSWILAAGVLDFRLKVATPEDYRPRKDVFERAISRNPKIAWMSDPHEAVREAHVIYTDVWASMGQEDEAEARRRAFEPYQVNAKLLESAPKDALVMHCLPAHRGEEITEDVIEGPRSIVFDQAENRMHLQKALLVYLLKGFMP